MTVKIGKNDWEMIEVVKKFKNGRVAVRCVCRTQGPLITKRKVFHFPPEEVPSDLSSKETV